MSSITVTRFSPKSIVNLKQNKENSIDNNNLGNFATVNSKLKVPAGLQQSYLGVKFGNGKFAEASFKKLLKEQKFSEKDFEYYSKMFNGSFLALAAYSFVNIAGLENLNSIVPALLRKNVNFTIDAMHHKLYNSTPDIEAARELLNDENNKNFFVRPRNEKIDFSNLTYNTYYQRQVPKMDPSPNLIAVLMFAKWADKTVLQDDNWEQQQYLMTLFNSYPYTLEHQVTSVKQVAPQNEKQARAIIRNLEKNLSYKTSPLSTEQADEIQKNLKNCAANKNLLQAIKALIANLEQIETPDKIKFPTEEKINETLKTELASIAETPEFETLSDNDKQVVILTKILDKLTAKNSTTATSDEALFYAIPIIKQLPLTQVQKSKIQVLIKTKDAAARLNEEMTPTQQAQIALSLKYQNALDLFKIAHKAELEKAQSSDEDLFEKNIEAIKKYTDEYSAGQIYLSQKDLPQCEKGKLTIIKGKPDSVYVHGISRHNIYWDDEKNLDACLTKIRLHSQARTSDVYYSASYIPKGHENDTRLFAHTSFILDVEPHDVIIAHNDMNEISTGNNKDAQTFAHFLTVDEKPDKDSSVCYSGKMADFARILTRSSGLNTQEHIEMMELFSNHNFDELEPAAKNYHEKCNEKIIQGTNEFVVANPKIRGFICQAQMGIPESIKEYATEQGLPIYLS